MNSLSAIADQVQLVFPDATVSIDARQGMSFLDVTRGNWHGVVEHYPGKGLGLTTGMAVTEGYGMQAPDEWFMEEGDDCLVRLLILIQSGKDTIPGGTNIYAALAASRAETTENAQRHLRGEPSENKAYLNLVRAVHKTVRGLS